MNATPAIYDYQVGGYQLPTYTATFCADCRKPATMRLTVNRVEKYGVLIEDSHRDYCGEHIDAATKAARQVCQVRLYGMDNGATGKGKPAA